MIKNNKTMITNIKTKILLFIKITALITTMMMVVLVVRINDNDYDVIILRLLFCSNFQLESPSCLIEILE